MSFNRNFAICAVISALAAPSAYAVFPSIDSDGNFNTGLGTLTLQFVSGYYNTAIGYEALFSNTSGQQNTAAGFNALRANTIGSFNTAIGHQALNSNTSGDGNTATGTGALFSNTTGTENTGLGLGALAFNTSGNFNTAVGFSALVRNITGGNNIAIGFYAGSALTTGSYNVTIGNVGVAHESKTIRIGKQGTQTKAFVAGIRGATVSGATVVVSRTGQLGVQTSSRRFKKDIHPMGDVSSALLNLKPIVFRYRDSDEHGANPIQFGLIAEDVAAVLPELVVFDEEGRPETVAYQALSSLLLNEFQKEHARRLESETKAQSEIAQMKAKIGRLQKITEQILASQPSQATVSTADAE